MEQSSGSTHARLFTGGQTTTRTEEPQYLLADHVTAHGWNHGFLSVETAQEIAQYAYHRAGGRFTPLPQKFSTHPLGRVLSAMGTYVVFLDDYSYVVRNGRCLTLQHQPAEVAAL